MYVVVLSIVTRCRCPWESNINPRCAVLAGRPSTGNCRSRALGGRGREGEETASIRRRRSYHMPSGNEAQRDIPNSRFRHAVDRIDGCPQHREIRTCGSSSQPKAEESLPFPVTGYTAYRPGEESTPLVDPAAKGGSAWQPQADSAPKLTSRTFAVSAAALDTRPLPIALNRPPGLSKVAVLPRGYFKLAERKTLVDIDWLPTNWPVGSENLVPVRAVPKATASQTGFLPMPEMSRYVLFVAMPLEIRLTSRAALARVPYLMAATMLKPRFSRRRRG